MARPVRVICYAWGDKYVDDFLSLTLPALLAPGNLPDLAGRFDLEFVFLTEEQQFARVQASGTWRRLAALCRTELIALDDLIVGHWYGISLSKTLVRGFAGLGPRMLETDLLFFNADFIVADGSLRTVGDRLEQGHRLVFAPSYCVIRETVLPQLQARLSGGVLALPPRAMAALGIPNRHYTIRAKTANQRLFRIHRYDHVYWYVDDRTILARQMPIALVAMRPERVVDDIHTFWDYGVVSELCPSAAHCILGDSDDYLMIELRDERTFDELMRLGWPSIEEIAADLSSFTTRDQREHLRHELVWHAGDLPPSAAAARRDLAGFVDAVASRLSPEPVSHLNHQFWASSIGRFEEMRQAFLAARGAASPPPSPMPAAPEADAAAAAVAEAPPPQEPVRAIQPVAEGLAAEPPRRGGLIHRLVGRVPFVRRAHPYWADLRHAVAHLAPRRDRDRSRLLLVSSGAGLFAAAATTARSHRRLSPASLLAEERIAAVHRFDGDLAITVEDAAGVTRTIAARHVAVAQRQRPERLSPPPAAAERFDLCLCQLDWSEFTRFREILGPLRAWLQPDARIVVLCIAPGAIGAAARVPHGAFPPEGRSEVLYSGNALSCAAVRVVRLADRLGEWRGPAGRIAFLAVGALAALLSLAAAPLLARQDPRAPTRHSSSLTMVIDLP